MRRDYEMGMAIADVVAPVAMFVIAAIVITVVAIGPVCLIVDAAQMLACGSTEGVELSIGGTIAVGLNLLIGLPAMCIVLPNTIAPYPTDHEPSQGFRCRSYEEKERMAKKRSIVMPIAWVASILLVVAVIAMTCLAVSLFNSASAVSGIYIIVLASLSIVTGAFGALMLTNG